MTNTELITTFYQAFANNDIEGMVACYAPDVVFEDEVRAEFVIKDGKIVRHTDSFNLWRWARQALGLNGLLIGWSAFFQARMQETTRGLLADFQKAK